MVIEALVALGIITIATVNAPVETKSPQEIKSVSTTIDANKAVKPKAKPKKKKAAKKVNADPAKQLHISQNTMKTHLRNVYRKLGVDGRHSAVEKAKKLLLI